MLNPRSQAIGVIYSGHGQTELNDAGLFLPTLSDSKGATMSGLEGNLETTKEYGESRG